MAEVCCYHSMHHLPEPCRNTERFGGLAWCVHCCQNWRTLAGTLGCAASIQIGSFYQAIMSEHFYSGHHTITHSCLSWHFFCKIFHLLCKTSLPRGDTKKVHNCVILIHRFFFSTTKLFQFSVLDARCQILCAECMGAVWCSKRCIFKWSCLLDKLRSYVLDVLINIQHW